MELQRRYIEEVGEAVEALGIMLEKELRAIKQGLAELYQFIAQIKDEEKNLSQAMQELKEEMMGTQKLLQGFETIISRTESKFTDLQKDLSEEDFSAEIKNDLLIIKRDLQFARSDLKELLSRQEDLEKKWKEFKEGKERFEG
ncbi:MAG: hypothetical protein AMJ91_03840 [candidate division Zixibacteria bacterium SM23_73_3]|nr:MAG: hypothetical protein AMJ91_03840 [candidate division Zixibacteria bacterium SM23_73_3]